MAIRRECAEGMDVYFDNVGGPTLDAALANLRTDARVVFCGRISQTVATEPYGIRNLGLLGGKRVTMRNFLVFDYHSRYPEARAWLSAQIRGGRLRQQLHIVDGLENAPRALGMLFRGENTGKLVVKSRGLTALDDHHGDLPELPRNPRDRTRVREKQADVLLATCARSLPRVMSDYRRNRCFRAACMRWFQPAGMRRDRGFHAVTNTAAFAP